MAETDTQYTGKHRPRGMTYGGKFVFPTVQTTVREIQLRLYGEKVHAFNEAQRQQTGGTDEQAT